MFKKVLLVLVALVVVLAGVVAMQPDTFHLERSAAMAAPPEVVFAQIDDFHRWADWSPWDELDPAMKRTYAGTGVGSTYAWEGTGKVGQGRMTLTEATPSSKVGVKLEFMKPFQATNQVTFTLAPEGGGTRVTWAMDGHGNFMEKAFHLVMNMDKMVGPDFEKGLASMKAIAEAEAKKQAAAKAAVPAAPIAPVPAVPAAATAKR